VNGQQERRLPNTLSISFHGLLANAILFDERVSLCLPVRSARRQAILATLA
jgi:hypothetical protein